MNSRQRKKLEMVRMSNERLNEALRVQREAGLALWRAEEALKKQEETLSGLVRRQECTEYKLKTYGRESTQMLKEICQMRRRLQDLERVDKQATVVAFGAAVLGAILLIAGVLL